MSPLFFVMMVPAKTSLLHTYIVLIRTYMIFNMHHSFGIFHD